MRCKWCGEEMPRGIVLLTDREPVVSCRDCFLWEVLIPAYRAGGDAAEDLIDTLDGYEMDDSELLDATDPEQPG